MAQRIRLSSLTFLVTAALAPVAEAQPPTVQVSICRFGNQTPAVTDQLADLILARCSDVMAKANCPVQFVRSGRVESFDNETGYILEHADYVRYNKRYAQFNVRIFNGINECNFGHAWDSDYGYAGCSDKPTADKSMRINVGTLPSLDQLVWLHEYGHNKDLRDIDSDRSKIMNHRIYPTCVGLRPGDCGYFQTIQGSTIPCAGLSGAGLEEGAEAQAAAPERPGDAGKIDVRSFIHSIPLHGFPFHEAARYGKEDARVLVRMLSDPAEKGYLPSIVTTLCFTEDPEAIGPLIGFFERGEGVLSTPEFNAKRLLLVYLGVLINGTRDERTVDFLLSRLKANGTWKERPAWVAPFNARRDKQEFQDRFLAKAALRGLGISGMPRAIEGLQSFRNASADEDISRAADEALKLHATIQQQTGRAREFFSNHSKAAEK